MTLSEAVAIEILHCNNSGIRPSEAMAADRFAYYPILMITYSYEIQKPSIALRERALSPKGQRTKFPNRNQISKSPRAFLLAGKDKNPEVIGKPEEVRMAPIAIEPKRRAITLHAEHAQAAAGISNRLHSD